MDLIWNGIVEALRLLFGGGGSIYEIAWRSLWISGLALIIAVAMGVPLGAAVALNEFGGHAGRGRTARVAVPHP
jgi:tungstate transport system permease protein